MENKKRLACLDLMKFVAMLFVVLYHARYMYVSIMNSPDTKTMFLFFCHTMLSCCVPIFFFVNGFLLINKNLDLNRHIKKTLKLILVTIIWGGISLISMIYIRGEIFSLQEFLKAFWDYKVHYINHLWFMGALSCIYFVFPLIKATFDNNRKVFNYFLVFCLIAVFANSAFNIAATVINKLAFDQNKIMAVNWLNMYNPFRGVRAHTLAFFLLGGYFGANKDRIDEKLKKIKIINPVTLILTFVLSTLIYTLWGYYTAKMTGEQWDTVWYGYDEVFILIDVICIYLLFENYKASPKNPLSFAVRAVSKNTLGIYFLHMIVIDVMNALKIGEFPWAQNYIVYVIYCFAILYFCAFVSMLAKKIPLIKNLF